MAANALKGEVDLTVGSQTFTLCFTTNAIVEVETVSGKDIVSILSDWQETPAYGPLRLLLWGATRKHYSDFSLFTVGDMLDEIGPNGMEELGALIGKALRFRISGTAVDAESAGQK